MPLGEGVIEWYQSFGYRELACLEDEDETEEDNLRKEEDLKKKMMIWNEQSEEDENEPELTYPYKSIYEVGESSTATIPREDGDRLLPGFMRRDIDSLFGRMVNFSRRLCGRETAHALVEKKGKAKDKFYGKLILDLGNEVRSSVEQRTVAMEGLVEKIGNVEEKAECKKLTKELEEPRGFVFEERPNEAINVPIEDEKSPLSEPQGSPHDAIMHPKSAPMTQAATRRLIKESVDAVIAAERESQAKVRNDASGSGPVRGQDTAPVVQGKKVRFPAATLEGPALTWWNSKIATLGLDTVNRMPWTKMKQLMTAEFYPIEEIQRMEHELWNLKVKEYDIVAYTKSCAKAHKFDEQKIHKLEIERIFGMGGGKTRKIQTQEMRVPKWYPAPTDGKLPLCERCFTRHVGQCTIKCHKCGKVGHKSRTNVRSRSRQEEFGESSWSKLMLLRTLSIESRMWLLKSCTLARITELLMKTDKDHSNPARLFLFPYVEDLRMRILPMFNTILSIRIELLYTLIHPYGSLELIQDKLGAYQDLFGIYEPMVWSFVDMERQEFLFYFPRQCHSSRNSSSDQYDTDAHHLKYMLCLKSHQPYFLRIASSMVSETLP
ncbi:hypothetical protein Tco_0897286 [Tanacetum coccineum]